MLHPKPTPGDTAWFVHDRFGMFIHWGLYAQAARHEWVQSQEGTSGEEYQKYFSHFDPDLFNPKEWAREARLAGMKYFVITAKHHEGFCLWDSQFTDYKATNTAAKRDLIREVTDAFRAEGLHVGLYYSLLDWHHPHYTIDVYHPLRNHPDAEAMNADRDMKIYAKYMRDHVRELLTGYGKIDIIWFDFSFPDIKHGNLPGKSHEDWESEKLITMVRELQPKIMVDNRLDLPKEMTDVVTPEQFQPTSWAHVDGEPMVWEACQTLSGSWGYHRDEMTWKSPQQLVQMLINTVALGGNLLMNVGPTARGYLDSRANTALESYADWMKLHQRSIYGCSQSEFQAPADVRFTQNYETNRLYVHIFGWPFAHLHLPEMGGKIEYAQLLNDASEVQFSTSDASSVHSHMAPTTPTGTVTLNLPVIKPDVVVPVVELFLK
ncbi:MAG: alpha-L-fucosidase [Abditibacteriaceae bacterium]